MRELRNTKIIAVDHGYGNMKTANTVTTTGIKAYETDPIFTGKILYINNKKAQESRCWTEKLGVNQCMIAAKNAVLDKFGVKIEESTVEQILRFGTADISAPYLDCISSIARQYVAELFSTLRKYEYNPDLLRLYVVGGGGCLIRNFGTYDKSRVTIIDDICATAKGYESLAYMSLKRRG